MTKQNAATTGLTEFRKSRVYAEGWNAARKSAKPSENPYRSEPERSRWLEGYTQGADLNGMKAFALLAALFAASGNGALAAPADATNMPAAVVSPAVYDFAAVEQPSAANGRYQTGAYFYGDDCGGNSVLTAQAQRTNAPGGVILNGMAGRQIAQVLNCDDRRSALSSYRDAFQGKVGQAYPWRNPNGGASGDITALRRYQDGAASCTSFCATAIVSQQTTSSQGTACRQPDGNWHTL